MEGFRICQIYTINCVDCILKIHGVLNVLSCEYAKKGFERIRSLIML